MTATIDTTPPLPAEPGPVPGPTAAPKNLSIGQQTWALIGVAPFFVFALMFLLLRWRSTVHVSALLNLVPATTALVAVPVLGEPLTVQAVLGLVVALVGMYVGLGLVRRRSVGTTSA